MSFARLLTEAMAADGLPATGDVLSIGLPFLRQLDDLHRSGRVSRLAGVDGLTYDGVSLQLNPGHTQTPLSNPSVIARLNPEISQRGVDIVRRVGVDDPRDARRAVESLDVYRGAADLPDRPVFAVGYRAWEQFHDHHDVLTDIHLAGMLLVSYVTGLDFDNDDSIDQLVFRARHLAQINPALHPVVAGVLGEMISPDRHARPSDLADVIFRLEHHRDLPSDLDLTEAYQAAAGWQAGVLSALRERVFDVSRRNRSLYFKWSSSALSLTEASVPLLLDVNRIKAEDLLTWSGETAAAFRSGQNIDLERWCRFEEVPHLAPGLDKLIASERRLRTEQGQGRLRLVIAFLRWVDPESGDVIDSPLITLPAELTKKKGVRDRYHLKGAEEGEINPILRYVFRQRFGIMLPESVSTDYDSIVALTSDLQAMVRATDQSVTVDLIDTPRVNIIRRRAQLRVDAYRRRRARAMASSGRWRRQEHSYDVDDWRPLGLALYRRYVEPKELPLRNLAGAKPRHRRPDNLSAATDATRPGERVASQYEISTGDVNRHRWEVDLCAVTLASLGSRRSSLVRDYDALLGENARMATQPDHPFDMMFSPEPKRPGGGEVAPISVDQVLVLPADEAQAQAVRRGLNGESLIIQGPPGTGKSQTIANLIAALVAEGRRVLFVCEKRAALDVVAQRLRQVGLGQLVATIHDSQLDRKEFIADLGDVYWAWLGGEPDGSAAQRHDALASVNTLLGPLEQVFSELQDERGDRISVAVLIERLVRLRLGGVTPAEHIGAPGLSSQQWFDGRRRLGDLVDELARTGRTGPLGHFDVLRVKPHVVAVGDPVVAARALGEQLVNAATELAEMVASTLDPSVIAMESIDAVAAHLPILSALADHHALGVLDSGSGAQVELRAEVGELDRLAANVKEAQPVLERWRDVPDTSDTASALAIARAKEGSLFRFLDRRWRQVNELLHRQYRYDLHQIEPAASQVLEELLAFRSAEAALVEHQALLQHRYGVVDGRSLLAAADQLGSDPLVQAIAAAGSTLDVAALQPALAAMSALCRELVVEPDATLADLTRIGRTLQRVSVADERTLGAWGRLDGVADELIRTALNDKATPDEIEGYVLNAALEASSIGDPPSGAQLEQTVEQLLERYRKLLRANAAYVAGRARERFAENVEFSEASMAGRSDEDKDRKRSYRAGRKLLEREFDKKSRFRSIRELASDDSGGVVRDLKPIWLMSPLSVSDTLPLDHQLFDVVIFDEASQIPVEDAVPALFRADQTVVVGDRMQLPPTRFFSTGSDEDNEIVVDEDDQHITITLDADSFLTQADLALDSSMLTWHYRSRYESLISYSNHAFYRAQLATIPDQSFDVAERTPILVSAADDAASYLPLAMQRPISFHRLEHGVYESRRNAAEADYIAEMVRAMLVSGVGHSIGIVAFSEAQQRAIESSLAELAVLDRRFSELLDAEQVRSEDGEFIGLFVKNLENVQGDERDVIIMSVCYGPDQNGKMRMNFGPINQAGGERRLNVIFSRAKQHMMVVSSIVGGDITNTYNDGAAHLARFLDYAAAESVGGPGGEAILRSLTAAEGGESSAVDKASHVATEIAQELLARGYEADVNVGRSSFTIDVAIRQDGNYALGIMIDPGPSESTPTVRLITEAGVLDAMQWPITRVLATEWWHDPSRVIDRIIHTLTSSAR